MNEFSGGNIPFCEETARERWRERGREKGRERERNWEREGERVVRKKPLLWPWIDFFICPGRETVKG